MILLIFSKSQKHPIGAQDTPEHRTGHPVGCNTLVLAPRFFFRGGKAQVAPNQKSWNSAMPRRYCDYKAIVSRTSIANE